MARPGLKAQVSPAPAQERAVGLDWGHLRFFLAMARTGSLSRAAKRLGVDRNTVARRVAALEAALGLALFERGPQGWTRTAGGDELADLAGRVEEDVLALARHADARDRALTGSVRLTTAAHLATHLLAPAVPLLRQRHPGLVLEIAADQRNFDLTRREADLAVRMGRPRDSGLVTRRLCELAYGLYAAQGSAPAERREADFAQDPFLGFDESLASAPQERWLARVGPDRQVVFRTNSTASLQAAARRGVGVALLPRYIGDADPMLRRVEAPDPPAYEVWLLVHGDLRRTPRVRAVIEWLDELVERARPALTGRAGGR
jgi:DNA-binding transcriptional LysR family regulator